MFQILGSYYMIVTMFGLLLCSACIGIAIHDRQHKISELQTAETLARQCIETLLSLINFTQQHRGMTSSIIGGNKDFEKDVDALEQSIERHLKNLAEGCQSSNTTLPIYHNFSNIQEHWRSTQSLWRNRSFQDNFDEHSQLIESLLAQITYLEELSGYGKQSERAYKESHFWLIQLPDLIENIGQIRALSSRAATLQHCDRTSRVKLQFLLQNLNGLVDRFSKSRGDIQTLLKQSDLDKLLELVKRNILSGIDMHELNPKMLFSDFSAVIQLLSQAQSNNIKALS